MIQIQKGILFSLFSLLTITLFAQRPKVMTSSEIYMAIEKLNVLGSVLYVAAHPDDENTRMISYFANERKMETTYLSLTRGDGGQNLIGPEISELLGVIRTQELLAARKVDGGKQMFSRANDFGYSKSPLETMDIWNKDEVLSDIVYTIRKIQPDIIINRFDNDINNRRTHGHHTASAVLSTEAFDITNDPSTYAYQLDYVKPWQASRLFFNTSWWFYGSREAFEKADKTNMIDIDAGVYYPMKGKSNGEIAAESRSMHKCQGMGSTAFRGSQKEYMKLLKGKPLGGSNDPFHGIDVTWGRIDADHITQLVTDVMKAFNPSNPASSLPSLIKVKKEILSLEDSKWKRIKLEEIDQIIQQCSGLYVEAIAASSSGAPGDTLELNLEIVKRSNADADLLSYQIYPSKWKMDTFIHLQDNVGLELSAELSIPADASYSNAYWLDKEGTLGMYQVENQELRGLPESNKSTQIEMSFEIEGQPFQLNIPITYKRTDPVKGEVYRPFEIAPAVSITPTEKVYVYANEAAKKISLLVKAGKDDFSGTVKLSSTTGNWKIEPSEFDVILNRKGQEQIVEFSMTPPADQEEASIQAFVISDGVTYDQKVTMIEYDHIPAQMILAPAEAKIVRINLEKAGTKVAYIMGAGDQIPASLAQVGYDVDVIDVDEINRQNLRPYDAVILGIRALNTEPRLDFKMSTLFDYVEQGGNMIVQYNTSRRLVTEQIAPYPLQLSRDRVTVEEAPVRFLKPDHPVLNEPNKITQSDFDGWVQERGLYFPNEWASEFEAILSSNDPGEDPKNGGLLIAKHGNGHYIYTGYSWFRELPAGVPGAYRLFTNLISLGKKNRS